MSEYQYYEFQAIDRPLGEADMEKLRMLSTRARITPTSFTNHYNYGDFGGNPMRLMKRWYDLHLYLADWGTRQLMIRLPKRLVDRSRLDRFLRDRELAKLVETDEHLILDIGTDDEGGGYEVWDDGSGWLAAMAPLRDALLSGDWRLLYLVWLLAENYGNLSDDETEPLAGIGPLTGGLQAFVEFFGMDRDLVQAAAEVTGDIMDDGFSSTAVGAAVASIPEEEKTVLLQRLAEGDHLVAAEVRNRVREVVSPAGGAVPTKLRTVSELRARATAIREERAAAEAERQQAERRLQEQEEEAARRARLVTLQRKGEAVWDEIEAEIGVRNPKGYDRAAALLFDLKALSEENGTMVRFSELLDALRLRHERKKQFIQRLSGLQDSG